MKKGKLNTQLTIERSIELFQEYNKYNSNFSVDFDHFMQLTKTSRELGVEMDDLIHVIEDTVKYHEGELNEEEATPQAILSVIRHIYLENKIL